MDDPRRAVSRRTLVLWAGAFAALAAAIIVRNLNGLDTAPPGLYIDEASIGYNAWAIAHFGVDEHGRRLPLYFEAFGEYKNPVYIYTLAALLRIMPLTVAVERVPAAVYGMITLLFVALATWRLTRSRGMTLLMLTLAALTPWLTQESRVGFEVIAMVALLAAALWCLAGEARTTSGRFVIAGVLFALAIVAYSAARVEVFLFGIAFIIAYRRSGQHGWWRLLVPVLAGYLVVGVWALLHPGALTAEFAAVNIGADHPGVPALLARFVGNYVQYFSPDFLFIHGDPNLRHNSDYTGMLLVAMLPLLLAGLYECWLRRRDPLPRFTVLCLVLGPVSGALTYPAPHALRGAVMLPFLFLLASFGCRLLLRVSLQPRVAAVAVVSVGVIAQGGLYTLDYDSAYPVRSAFYFDTGVLPAIQRAAQAANGHTVWLSSDIEQPYIQAFFALQPAPPHQPVDDAATPGLAALHMAVVEAAQPAVAAQPGDIIVMASVDTAPQGATLIAVEYAAQDPLARAAPFPLVDVYRFTG